MFLDQTLFIPGVQSSLLHYPLQFTGMMPIYEVVDKTYEVFFPIQKLKLSSSFVPMFEQYQ